MEEIWSTAELLIGSFSYTEIWRDHKTVRPNELALFTGFAQTGIVDLTIEFFVHKDKRSRVNEHEENLFN